MIFLNIIAAQLKEKGFPIKPENIIAVWEDYKVHHDLKKGVHPDELIKFVNEERLERLLNLPYKKEVEIGGVLIIDRAKRLEELKETKVMVEPYITAYSNEKPVIEITITKNGQFYDHDEFDMV